MRRRSATRPRPAAASATLIAIYDGVLARTDPRLTWERTSALGQLAEAHAAKGELDRVCTVVLEMIELARLAADPPRPGAGRVDPAQPPRQGRALAGGAPRGRAAEDGRRPVIPGRHRAVATNPDGHPLDHEIEELLDARQASSFQRRRPLPEPLTA